MIQEDAQRLALALAFTSLHAAQAALEQTAVFLPQPGVRQGHHSQPQSTVKECTVQQERDKYTDDCSQGCSAAGGRAHSP